MGSRHWGMGKPFGCLLVLLPCFAAHAGTVTYVYSDPQGTPLAEADAQGNITARFDYAPYGSVAMGSAPNGLGYTGHVNDPDTGLVYMHARYYDPVTARFLSVDPKTPAAGNSFNFNRYTYANNNPVVNIDPDGRDILVITGGRRSGSGNVFGHVAASVQGYGMASYGNATPLGSSTTQYITEQSAYRTQTVSVITTTPSQDALAANFIQTNQSQNTSTVIDNCAVKTNLIINASGVATSVSHFPATTLLNVALKPGVKTYVIPQNGEIPKNLQNILTRFDPPPPPPPPATPATATATAYLLSQWSSA